MASTQVSIICGGDMGAETTNKKSILNTNHETHKTGKTVKIVEPTYVAEKKIREKRLKVDALILKQIEKREDQFEDLKAKLLPRMYKKYLSYLLWTLLALLLLTLVPASVCHSHNCRCEVFWYESMVAGTFGLFVSDYKIYNLT